MDRVWCAQRWSQVELKTGRKKPLSTWWLTRWACGEGSASGHGLAGEMCVWRGGEVWARFGAVILYLQLQRVPEVLRGDRALGWTSRTRLMSSCWEVCTCCHEPPILLLMLALWGWIFKENEEDWFTSGEMFPYSLVPQGRQGTTRMLGEEGSGSVVQRLQRPGTHESWGKDLQADAAGVCCQHSLVPQPPCPSAGPVGGWVAGHPEIRPRWQPLTKWETSKHPGCLAKQLPV